MAKKKSDTRAVHMIDKTIGSEANTDKLMCGRSAKELGDTVVCVDPTEETMPVFCDTADQEGRMCPDCKRGVEYYAKGCVKGEREARLRQIMEMLDTAQHVAKMMNKDPELNKVNGSKMSH